MSWNELSERSEAKSEFAITQAEMTAFSDLSGDRNPVHMDATFAQNLGFDGKVVFGALIVAKISGLLGMQLPGNGGVWAGLKVDFRNPLYIGEKAILKVNVKHKSDATRLISLKLRIDTVDRCIATGTAESVYLADD